ncbi:MAG: AmmeMemoRadiSam system protein B [Rhodospirillales bacterium]|nr:AmmeMemoRadiSam system protein B [Rhodospirillales bacterium]
MPSIREAAVAGQFYPGSAAELDASVRSYLGQATPGTENVPKAIIAPHAGYVYSGAIAASAYARLIPARSIIKRVVLLGPCHRVAVQGLALSSASAFQTPLGDVPVDKEASEQILALRQVEIFDATHEGEHSLEVHLPFLQVVLDDFTVVPLVVGEAGPEDVADVLEALWGGPETLIVVSSDLSHYLDYASAQAIDQATCKAIETLNPGLISRDGACGRFPVGGLLEVAKRRGMTVTTLDLRNSGDTAGDKDHVVGYGSWMFQEARSGVAATGNEQEARTGVSPDRDLNKETSTKTKSPEDDFNAATEALLERHGEKLLMLAAGAIKHWLSTGKPMNMNLGELEADLVRTGACFITLKRDGKLRGCIGSSEAQRPLGVDAAENGFRAAFKDPRFPALTAEEIPGLELSISVLSAKSPMTFADEADFLSQLRPGIDGLVIEDGPKRALFLPSVWSQLPKTVDFVGHLKAKAGLSKDHWSDTFKAWRFGACELSASDLQEPGILWNN